VQRCDLETDNIGSQSLEFIFCGWLGLSSRLSANFYPACTQCYAQLYAYKRSFNSYVLADAF